MSDLCTVLTASDSEYQFWQIELAYYSFRRAKQPGDFLALIAQDQPGPLHRPLSCPHRIYRSCSPHPVTGDAYTPYNKPGLLLQWLRDSPDYSYLHIIDPDCVFTQPIPETSVQVGHPLADSIWFMEPTDPKGKFILQRHCQRRIEYAQPLAVPLLIHREDLAMIVERWFEATTALRKDKVCGEKWPWVEEMWAYVIASAEYGVNHKISLRQSLTDSAIVRPIIHYSYGVHAGSWKWDKRSYRPWAEVKYPAEVSASAKALFGLINEFSQTQLMKDKQVNPSAKT